jgi:hypothetical protein
VGEKEAAISNDPILEISFSKFPAKLPFTLLIHHSDENSHAVTLGT